MCIEPTFDHEHMADLFAFYFYRRNLADLTNWIRHILCKRNCVIRDT